MNNVQTASEIILVRPDETMLAEIADYRAAMLAAGSSMDGTSGLIKYEEPDQWLDHVRRMEKRETCPAHWVDSTLLVAQRPGDKRIVGMIDLRHRLNEHLAEFGGHIGYSVRPDERRKGYATRMLALTLQEARSRGLSRVMLTCNEDNEASRRTILSNGGKFHSSAWMEEEKATVCRFWIEL